MSQKLVLIGGAPGIGKSTLLDALLETCESVACLDADDVRRVRPLEFDERHGRMGVANVSAVARGYLEAGYDHVFVAWVFANPALTQRVVDAIGEGYDELHVVHLVASSEALTARSEARYAGGLDPAYQRQKAEEIAALPTPRIDVGGLSPAALARRILERIGSEGARSDALADRDPA